MGGAATSRGRVNRAVAQTGRKLGPRAMQTRQRLLDATAALMRERSVLDLPVVEITRMGNTSPATFYHYFKDVEEAALMLAEQAADEMPTLTSLVEGSWRGRAGLETARQIALAFMDHWESHHAVLLVRNLSADKGDRRFQAIRRAALAPFLEALARQVEASQAQGRVSEFVHPFGAAAAMGAILENLSAHTAELSVRGIARDALVETCARILFQTVTGRPAV